MTIIMLPILAAENNPQAAQHQRPKMPSRHARPSLSKNAEEEQEADRTLEA